MKTIFSFLFSRFAGSSSRWLLAAAVAVSLGGCSPRVPVDGENSIAPVSGISEFEVAVIDSCEYIVFRGIYKGGVCHKGNCKFCAERSKLKTR